MRNANRRILAYLRIWILNNNAEVGFYRLTLIKDYQASQRFNNSLRVLQRDIADLCNLMKQTFGIILATVYTLLIIGVPISVHHCDSMQEMSIVVNDDVSCCCSTTSAEKITCHSEPTSNSSNNNCCSNKAPEEDGCCTTKDQIVKFVSDQQLTNKHQVSFKLTQFVLLASLPTISLDDCKPKVNAVFLDLPPPQTKSTQILQHQFTFYG